MSHSVTLTWTPSTDMESPINTGDGYNVYRGTTSGKEQTTPINGTTPIAANTYVDTNVQDGKYDYYVTAVVGGAESIPSNEVQAVILPAPPTNLAAIEA